MIIGTFTRDSLGTFAGDLATLTGTVPLKIVPIERASDTAPDYRVYATLAAGEIECGAAWLRDTKKAGKVVSLRIDDPAWSAPLQCALLPTDESPSDHILIWQRDGRKERKAA
jgi:uncharacterized protein (DUF736 family)